MTSDFHTPIPFYGPTESTIYTQAKSMFSLSTTSKNLLRIHVSSILTDKCLGLYLEGVDKFGLVAATRLVRFFLPLSNAEEDVRAVFSSTREFLKAPLKASQVTKCWQGVIFVPSSLFSFIVSLAFLASLDFSFLSLCLRFCLRSVASTYLY